MNMVAISLGDEPGLFCICSRKVVFLRFGNSAKRLKVQHYETFISGRRGCSAGME